MSEDSNNSPKKRLVIVEPSSNSDLSVFSAEEMTIVFDDRQSSIFKLIAANLSEHKLYCVNEELRKATNRERSDRLFELLSEILQHIQDLDNQIAKYTTNRDLLVEKSEPILTKKLLIQVAKLQEQLQILRQEKLVLETILDRTIEQANFNKSQLEKKLDEQCLAQATLLEINQELEKLIYTDGLTQIANRRYFDDYLLQEWQKLRQKSAFLSLILCDIDYFKVYNDTYGHLIGDYCLQQVALSIESVAESSGVAARYGGEEFGIILPNISETQAMAIAERIRLAVKSLKIEHQNSPVHRYVTMSLGVYSLIPSPHSTPDLAIALADKALYEAKVKGRDRACAYGD